MSNTDRSLREIQSIFFVFCVIVYGCGLIITALLSIRAVHRDYDESNVNQYNKSGKHVAEKTKEEKTKQPPNQQQSDINDQESNKQTKQTMRDKDVSEIELVYDAKDEHEEKQHNKETGTHFNVNDRDDEIDIHFGSIDDEKEKEKHATKGDDDNPDIIDMMFADDRNNNGSRRKEEVKKCLGKVWKQFFRYKSIYLAAVIHFSDVITDYLVLIQYVVLAFANNDKNINYVYVSIASILTIILNKILTSYYILKFTKNKWDVLLNIFDFYIFIEIYASHKNGNKTDLMKYLQKIERVFESSPQFGHK